MFATFGADPMIFVEGSKAAVALKFVFCLSHAPIIPTYRHLGRETLESGLFSFNRRKFVGIAVSVCG